MGPVGSLDLDVQQNLKKEERKQSQTAAHKIFTAAKQKQANKNLTLAHKGFAWLVASTALLDEVLGHPVGPGWRIM